MSISSQKVRLDRHQRSSFETLPASKRAGQVVEKCHIKRQRPRKSEAKENREPSLAVKGLKHNRIEQLTRPIKLSYRSTSFAHRTKSGHFPKH